MKRRLETMNAETQAVEWEKKYSIENYFREGPSSLAQLVEKIIRNLSSKRILELGCGQGQDAIHFGKKGAIVTALDFSQKAVESARTKIKRVGLEKIVTAIKADISDLKLPEKSFDIVFANLSLHYFDDKTTKRIFDDIYRYLKLGGYLFLEVKSTEDVDYGIGKQVEKDFFDYNGKRRHFFSEAYLLECVKQYDVICVQSKKYASEGKLSSFLSTCVQKPFYR